MMSPEEIADIKKDAMLLKNLRTLHEMLEESKHYSNSNKSYDISLDDAMTLMNDHPDIFDDPNTPAIDIANFLKDMAKHTFIGTFKPGDLILTTDEQGRPTHVLNGEDKSDVE